MEQFPTHANYSLNEYVDAYASRLRQALQSVDPHQLDAACKVLRIAAEQRKYVFVCGNGGSAAISDHLCCDHLKGVATNTHLRPRLIALTGSTATITAIANDMSYDEIFSYQLKSLGSADDVLIVISSSGNSPNVVQAICVAKDLGLKTIGMTGFSGGKVRALVDCSLHVDIGNYGIVEDTHQAVMHVLAQYLRLQAMKTEDIASRKF